MSDLGDSQNDAGEIQMVDIVPSSIDVPSYDDMTSVAPSMAPLSLAENENQQTPTEQEQAPPPTEQEQAPPQVGDESTEDDEPRKEPVVYTPPTFWRDVGCLAIFFILGVIILPVLVFYDPLSVFGSTSSSNSNIADDTDANKRASLCMWQLNKRFLGTNAFRLSVGAPQRRATEWLAVDDNACGNMDVEDIDVSSAQMAQRYALMVLYFATGGENWGMWALPGVSECSWSNIECSGEEQNVTALSLMKAIGKLPEEIGLLSSLVTLDLSANDIRGAIPVALYSLTNLVSLSLAQNKFVGSIDSGIGNLTKLEYLELSRNVITGILPTTMTSLSNLKELEIADTEIEGDVWSMIPSWLELENLHIANSKFRGSIPTEIGNLSRLHSLKFAGTETTGIIPTQIGLTSALRLVAAVRIEIEGSLPSEVGMLSMLTNFELQGTSMRGGTIPSEVGQCSSLEYLLLGESGYVGSIPSELGMLTFLRELVAKDNDLTGTVPTEFHNLPNLELLDLGLNADIGPIPLTLCNAVKESIVVDCSVDCSCCVRVC